MTQSSEGQSARRVLWGLVIGVVVLNVVLFLVFSRTRDAAAPSTRSGAASTNTP